MQPIVVQWCNIASLVGFWADTSEVHRVMMIENWRSGTWEGCWWISRVGTLTLLCVHMTIDMMKVVAVVGRHHVTIHPFQISRAKIANRESMSLNGISLQYIIQLNIDI